MTIHRRHRALGSFLLPVIAALLPSAGFAQTITEVPLHEGARPGKIVASPDGNLWFTVGVRATTTSERGIGRMTTSGSYVDFPIEDASVAGINDLATGPDGNLWFTQSDIDGGHASINRMTPAGVLTRFPLPGGGFPLGITGGPDGNVWFTLLEATQIGRITPGGVITLFSLSGVATPLAITAGPDGNLWFTAGLNRIGRITTSGVFDLWPTAGNPRDITAGPDGNLWFTEFQNNIGRITPQGVVTEFPVPEPGFEIVTGADGNLWFTRGFWLGRITTSGVVTEVQLPEPAFSLTAGADGNLWFTETGVGRIGRLSFASAPAIDLRVLPVVGSTSGVGGSFFRTSVQLHNSGTAPSSGGIRFHPSGTAGSSADPVSTFTLAPGETRTIPDLLPAMNLTGLGSADVFLTAGNAPLVTARVFNDAGTAGTTGFALSAMRPQDAVSAGRHGVLLIPADLVNYRLNVGLRTLDANVSMTLTVRNAAGAVAATVPKFFPAIYHEQQAATAFLNGLPLPAGGSITVSVEAGSAIVYGATVDNRTGDPSLQIAAPAP